MGHVHPLAQLIEDVKAMSDPPMSNRELARRSGLSSTRMHQLVTDEMRAMPDPDTLRGLANGLRVPLRLVVDAALASLGLPHGAPDSGGGTVAEMRRIVETSTVLTPEDRETWTALIDVLEARTRERKGRRGA